MKLRRSSITVKFIFSLFAVVVSSSVASVNIDASGAGWNYLSAAENYHRISPPDAKAIKLEYNEVTENVLVVGNPGSVPADTNVMVANLELGRVTLVRADSAGAFETSVAASPGNQIHSKQDTTGQQSNLNHGVDEQLINEGPKSPGIILSIPAPETENGYGFAGGGRVPGEDTVWVVEGSLSKISFQEGDRAIISGKLSILANVPVRNGISYNITGQMIGDENGLQVGPGGIFASNILTPTGLPVVPGINNGDFFNNDCNITPLNWRQEKDKSVADFSCDMKIETDTPGGTPVGTYIMWLTLHFPEAIQNAQNEKLLAFGRSPNNMVALSTVNIDSPKPMRLATTLFADLLQEGTRGGVWSREDAS